MFQVIENVFDVIPPPIKCCECERTQKIGIRIQNKARCLVCPAATLHFTQNKRKNERWNKEIEEVLEELSSTSPQTTQLSVMEEHLRVLLRVAPTLWSHYTKHRCSLVRMDNYIHKRKTLQQQQLSQDTFGVS